jgi:hypothetical protein
MKKLYSLMFSIALAFSANAQNLVTNPTFSDGLNGWTAGTTSSYTLPTLVTTDGSDDLNSVQYTPTATTGFYQEIDIIGGSELTISFWYKATGDDTDARIWSNYKDAANTIVYQAGTSSANIADDPLRNNNLYLPTSATWTQHSVTVVSPAIATKLVLAVRAYSSSTVSFDQFSVIQTPLSVKQNTIAGLKLYPNPVSNGTLFIETAANAEKTIAVYDVLGKNVLTTSTLENTVNVSSLRAGIYMVNITEEGKTATRKLVIK